jgi:molybdate transport system permease protein
VRRAIARYDGTLDGRIAHNGVIEVLVVDRLVMLRLTSAAMSERTRTGDRRDRRTSVPIPVLVLATVAVLFFALPLAGLLWRAPWSKAWQYLSADDALTALRLSLTCSLWATALSFLLGVPLAWVLARVEFTGRGVVRALCTLSMVIPPVVGGVALFFALGRRGIVGQYLDQWFGIRLPFTTAGVVVAQTFVAMPFLIITVEAALRQMDRRVEDASRTLGASSWYTFRRVTLPAIRPALIAGCVLAWARALGEFGATITFAGNFPGTTQTLPLAVYLGLETNPEQAIVLSLVLIAISFAVLVGLRDRWFGQRTRPEYLA